MMRKISAALLAIVAPSPSRVGAAEARAINALWILTAAVCVYLLGVPLRTPPGSRAACSAVDASRATPAERLNNGRDFVPTHRAIVSVIISPPSPPGPLVGPTLAAQFANLPGTLWILVGARCWADACRT